MVHISLAAGLAATALFVQPAFSALTIAHRGLFKDVNDGAAISENTVSALQRASQFGLPGVEFDVRLSSDGVPFIVHDMIGNRCTDKDNYDGKLNPVDVALNIQPKNIANTWIGGRSAAYWNRTPLKVYARNAKLRIGSDRLETLEAMIGHLKNLNKPNFLMILDIQDPAALRASAAIVKRTGMEKQVILKFFAKKAMDSKKYKFSGFETCGSVARGEGLVGLQVIPQFNDGELTFINGRAFVDVFQTRLLVTEYLSCWFDAQKAFGGGGAALVPIVSASVPSGNQAALDAATDALLWASEYGRKRMAIVPNPDVGRNTGRQCSLFVFQSTSSSAALFSQSAHDAKEAFAIKYLRSSDYVVADLIGNVQTRAWRSDLGFFKANLC